MQHRKTSSDSTASNRNQGENGKAGGFTVPRSVTRKGFLSAGQSPGCVRGWLRAALSVIRWGRVSVRSNMSPGEEHTGKGWVWIQISLTQSVPLGPRSWETMEITGLWLYFLRVLRSTATPTGTGPCSGWGQFQNRSYPRYFEQKGISYRMCNDLQDPWEGEQAGSSLSSQK